MILILSKLLQISALFGLITLCCASEEYVIADGIKISKLDFQNMKFENEKEFLDLEAEERALEYSLQVKEKSYIRNAFPTDCHVCRLFVEELMRFLQKNGEIEKEREGETPIFVKNGNVIYRAMQEVCPEMKNYRVSRIRPFRYVRGGSTPIREIFNKAQSQSRVKKWIYSVPESELDDPTGEIQRLYAQCESLIEEEEDRIINWFFKSQSKNPWKWLCADRVLKDSGETECLNESLEIKENYAKKIAENAKAEVTRRTNKKKKSPKTVLSI